MTLPTIAMLKRLLPVYLLLLAACGSAPVEQKPARVQLAEAAVLAANRSTQVGADQDAVAYWQDALDAYASIDHWAGQGEARLGLAQGLARLARRDEAHKVLAGMPEEHLYPDEVRARAAYQQALLLIDRNQPDTGEADRVARLTSARERLGVARQLCGAACGWSPRLDNVEAKLEIGAGHDERAAQILGGLLARNDVPSGERAHALRLSAEVALRAGDAEAAKKSINEALVLDRQLAEPAYLIDDYLVLRQALSADAAAQAEVDKRLDALCSVFAGPPCRGR
ncbi:hypothetical protein [Andreprevotia chitinilytica]|uniref:hypothetical protein n=1 Tax=Andreprevotia chitinilytica TaxID=396808 RepID=UPI00068E5963|nr:hypothetical protein [Andreprevotia chitinilytica]